MPHGFQTSPLNGWLGFGWVRVCAKKRITTLLWVVWRGQMISLTQSSGPPALDPFPSLPSPKANRYWAPDHVRHALSLHCAHAVGVIGCVFLVGLGHLVFLAFADPGMFARSLSIPLALALGRIMEQPPQLRPTTTNNKHTSKQPSKQANKQRNKPHTVENPNYTHMCGLSCVFVHVFLDRV
jgi:hypothetical protein